MASIECGRSWTDCGENVGERIALICMRKGSVWLYSIERLFDIDFDSVFGAFEARSLAHTHTQHTFARPLVCKCVNSLVDVAIGRKSVSK